MAVDGAEGPSKVFHVNVFTENEWVGSIFDWAECVVPPGLAAQIKKLAAACKDLGVWRIERFDYSLEYHWSEETSTECPLLCVCENRFYWRGHYKDSDIRFETEPIDIALLDSPEAIHELRQEIDEPGGAEPNEEARACGVAE